MISMISKLCFSVYCILICICRYGWIPISCLTWKLQLFMCQSLNSSHLSVFDHWILNPKYPYHCILWIYTSLIASRHIVLHHMHIFVLIILYNVSCWLPHVIHTDSTQYKQLQNYILLITSDHANVWVYIWVLFKSNIPVPLKCMLILLWYLNLLLKI